MPSQDASATARRGWAARSILAEDARWAMDVVLSSQQAGSAQDYLPLIFGHHLVRIAYEGALAIRSSDPNVGIPEFAVLLRDKFATMTERTRHTSKLLDNSGTKYEIFIRELETIQGKHHDRFTGNAHRWLRWLETDLGLYQFEGALVGATVPAAYRLGLDIDHSASMTPEDLREVSEEWGGTLAVLGCAALDDSAPTATIDFARAMRIRPADKLSDRYLVDRFDSDLPLGLKLLFLMVEGDLNTSQLLLPRMAGGHEMAVFRAQAVTAYHALASLRKIADKNSRSSSPGLTGLRTLLNDLPTQRLLSHQGKKIRDRCVHYPILNPTFEPDPSLPMLGTIESVARDMTWEGHRADVLSVTRRAADCMASWRP